jgi:hypothetical protein
MGVSMLNISALVSFSLPSSVRFRSMPPRPLPQDKFRDIIRTLIKLATNIQDMQPAIQAFLDKNPDIEQDLAEDGTSVNSRLTALPCPLARHSEQTSEN